MHTYISIYTTLAWTRRRLLLFHLPPLHLLRPLIIYLVQESILRLLHQPLDCSVPSSHDPLRYLFISGIHESFWTLCMLHIFTGSRLIYKIILIYSLIKLLLLWTRRGCWGGKWTLQVKVDMRSINLQVIYHFMIFFFGKI